MPKTKLDTLKRKEVIVRANGTVYKGILLEATEEEITLKTQTRFLTVMMEHISSIEDATQVKEKLSDQKVDPSFYNADET